ncbi:MAG: hypothetical protein RL499_1570 [Actinomycetota bacterium]
MSSFDDLGRAFRDDAAVNAPRASVINVDAVTHAARARRRPRQWAVGTLSVVAALGVGGLALQTVTPPTLIAASESTDSGAVESAGGADLLAEPAAPEALGDRTGAVLACGAAVPEGFAHSAVALSIDLSSSSPGAEGEVVGVAVLTNSSSEPLTISTGVEVTGVLEQGGVVVTDTLVSDGTVQSRDLAPSERLELPLRVSTRSCTGDPLPAGTLSAIAVLEVTVPSTGESFVLVASPQPVTLD